MDIITQGLVGAVAAQSFAVRKEVRYATVIGFFAGLLADADVFIRSSHDPLYTLEFHRHFTHSLIFIPIGGLIAAGILWLFFRNKLSFFKILLYATLGVATSGMLDAFTSYGTHLLWPFSDDRIAWRAVSIVDPVFSLTLISAIFFAARFCNHKIAIAGAAFVFAYLSFGVHQRDRAEGVILQIAASRGHTPQRYEAKPTMGNLVLWRSIYEADGIFYVDAIRLGFVSELKVYPGKHIKKFELKTDLPKLTQDDVLHNDIKRFSYLSNNYIAFHPQRPYVLGDIRYSLLPNDISPIWGIEFHPSERNKHVSFNTYRDMKDDTMDMFIDMLLGRTLRKQ